MSRAAVSVFVSGVYRLLFGVVLVVTPGAVLALFHSPMSSEVWLRVVGLLFAILGLYDVQMARFDFDLFFRLTVPARAAVVLLCAVFAALGLVRPPFVLFGLPELVGATWTYFALPSRL